jgi:replicative DNA helicase
LTPAVSPHNLEAERAILGGILVDPERVFDVADMLSAADFFRDAHKRIFGKMLELSNSGRAIDFLTLQTALGKDLEVIGGPAYLSALSDGMPRSSNVRHYAETVKGKAVLRNLLAAANRIIDTADESEQDTRALVDRAEQLIFEVSQQSVRGDFIDAAQLVQEGTAYLQRLSESKGVSGVRSGFADFDHMTQGFQPGTLNLIAARPSMGKTAFAMNVAYQAALAGQHVGFFSLEMSRDELYLRLVSSVAKIDSHRLKGGYLSQTEYDRLVDANSTIAESFLHIDDTPVVSLMDVRGKARRRIKSTGLSLLIIDYLQLMQLPKAENRNLSVSEVSRGLKLLARELEIPVVALSQLSRETEKRGEKRPMLSDLRDSGALEQDADLVVFIHRPEVYGATPDNAGIAEIVIAKHRNGLTGTVELSWCKENTRFDNLTRRRDVASGF